MPGIFTNFTIFYIEPFAVMLGSILAFYYRAQAYTLNDNFSRFVGFGFLVAAVIVYIGLSMYYQIPRLLN
jgi:hypothetical protein